MSVKTSAFARNIFNRTYAFYPDETWPAAQTRVIQGTHPDKKDTLFPLMDGFKILAGGRYQYGIGRPKPQNSSCFLFRCKDSAKGWAELKHDHTIVTATGGGCGTEYSEVREKGAPIQGYGGTAEGPVGLMRGINDDLREMKAGAARRGALWAGLNWDHPDIEEFARAKDWDPETTARKAKNFNYPAALDQTNISIGLDDNFFEALRTHRDSTLWHDYVGWVRRAMLAGDPGFAINLGAKRMENLRNPCTEVTSRYNGDNCNLGSVNFSKIRDLDELEEVTRLTTEFLLMGTVNGWLPPGGFAEFEDTQKRLRRIGVGLMGLGEWFIQRELPYARCPEIERWLQVWQEVSDDESQKVSKRLGIAMPVAVRAVAPTGTIAIMAGTTGGIEPLFSAAYKRTYDDHGVHKHQYVVDPVTQRALARGTKPEDIEDAYSLSRDVTRRLDVQVMVQEYCDQGISSTINLPAYGQPGNEDPEKMAGILLEYMPKLRGITLYPDGARGGQPLQVCSIEEAEAHSDTVFQSNPDTCKGDRCGV